VSDNAAPKQTIITVKAQIETPRVPNFFRMTDGQMLPVCAVEDEGLRQIAAAWLEDLRANAKRQRETGSSGDSRKVDL
jgi:hypothetical protein